MNSEEQYIEMEAARIDSSEQYFSARPQIDGLDRRRVFESGFDRGWKAALNSQTKSEVDEWKNAALRIGEDLCSVGPTGYYGMSAKEWLEWALTVVTFHTPQPPQSIEADKVRELEKDAARYRWLRDQASAAGICAVHIEYWSEDYRGMAHCEVFDGEFLDKAIDKAMKGK